MAKGLSGCFVRGHSEGWVDRWLVDYFLVKIPILPDQIHHHLDRIPNNTRAFSSSRDICSYLKSVPVFLSLKGVLANQHPVHNIIVMSQVIQP